MQCAYTLFAAAFGLAIQSACTPIGDKAFTVRGEAMDAASDLYSLCLLDTRDAASTIVDRHTISGKFDVTVFVAPHTHDYSFAISCAGAAETYQSPLFRIGTDRLSNPINLGRIVLKRS